jgi:uracil-DNA glycosylase family 4
MAKLLAVTGPNGSGKSTIAEKLNEELKNKYIHFDKVKTMEEGKAQYFNFLKSVEKNDNYILDRFFEGEDVYAPLYRNYRMDYLLEIEREIVKDNNFMFAYINADLQTIINRINVRGEDYVKPEHFGTERKLFDEFFMKQHLPFVNIDTSMAPIEMSLDRIKNAMNKVDTIWNLVKCCTNNKCQGVIAPTPLPRGNIEAKYMIVGQNPGGRGQGSQFQTAWSEGKTPNFLKDVLIEADIYMNCWFTNIVLCSTKSNTVDNNQINTCLGNLKTQVELIQPKVIFALGGTVTKTLKTNFPDCEIIEVLHPTYVKRFYSGKKEKLTEYINSFKVGV